MTTSLKTLITKLNTTCRAAAERAASLTMARGHYEVDLEHLFLALLEQPACDFTLLCRRQGISTSALTQDLEREIARFRSGNTRTPVFSPHLPTLFEHAWLIASLDARQPRIRSAHLLLALLTEPALSQLALRGSAQFVKFSLDDLKHHLTECTVGSQEAVEQAAAGEPGSPAEGGVADAAESTASGSPAARATPALDQYTTNLTQRAHEGRLDPVIGRDTEIRQTIDILMRRRQNNPILTGEAGVGKTAVAEGLALRIAAGDVPPPLQGVALHVLDMGLLQAGASVKGEFENRLKAVIDEVKRSPHPIILFIDEAHTMIGAGGQAGQNDAANLLKPALARGELRTVAATTWGEYKKYFEKDAALARRFQVVKIDEPAEPVAAAMLRGMAALMERHFNVRVLDEAITEAVRLSARYISGRQLPDKAIGVLDTACAKVALGLAAQPAAIEQPRRLLEHLEADAGPPPAAVLIVGKWCEALLAAGLVMYLVLRHGLPARVFGLRTDGLGVQSVWSLAGLAGCYAGLLATGVVILLFYLAYPDMKKELAERMEFIKALPRDNTLVMLALLVPVAVHEELVFRGLLMPYLRRLTGKWWSALLVSALIFGALHIPGQGLVGGLQTTVVGCVLGLVFIVSRSLLAVALAHLLFNFAQLQIIRFVSQYAEFAPLGG
ncbi:MAG: CPBP family intramembrane metalloprotease [Burkholderiaceae bacterium]|nr:CPBP family intramembrane metalloprotease [Burkholderiaceae bacterium]